MRDWGEGATSDTSVNVSEQQSENISSLRQKLLEQDI
jgi:hypothetical protein